MDEIRARFLPRFVATARERTKAALAGLDASAPELAGTVASELHTLAGEASMLGFAEVAEPARIAETAAKRWRSEGDATAALACARAVRAVVRSVEALAMIATRDPTDASASEAAPEPRKVLVVDDSRLSAQLLCDALEARGFATCWAGDAASLVETLSAFRPTGVLLDVHLPGMTSQDLCDLVRRQAGTPAPWIVLVSGLGAKDLGDIAQRVGADGFISKDSDAGNLVGRLQAILTARSA